MPGREKKYKYIINTSSDLITLINKDYCYEVVNESYCNMLGKNQDEILDTPVSVVWGEDRFKNAIKSYLDRCFEGEEIHYVDQFNFGDSTRYMHVSFYPYNEEDNEITHALVFSHDISKLGEIESKLLNFEFRDPVTGLFNDRSLDIILDMELEKAKRSQAENKRCLLILSMDNFQKICLEHSIATGNMLLENTGIRVKECLRTTDYVFRYNGNELAVVLTGMARETEPLIVAQKLINAVSIPYRKSETNITMNCTIGIAVFPEDGSNCDDLIRNASKALSSALSQGKEYRLYDQDIQKVSMSRLELENDLNRAFDLNQFELYYQAIVDENRVIKGCETLIRWNHPSRGMVPPSLFIPISEQTGIISAISKWVLFKTARQIKEWSDKYGIYTSVNLTAREYGNPDLPAILASALKQADKLSPRFLHLEITESETMENPENSIKQMQAIREMGFEIFMDDFGTGHSSLSYLKNIPADTLKLDKSFVDNITTDKDSRDFLELITHLARNRKKSLIVEGVETEEQLKILLEAGCKKFQGYLFSAPIPPAQFENLLKKNQKII
ncbi:MULTISPECIES: EAL domain-containing protein [unclassified Oceanispirochaeta]|nr:MULTISPECIES: EAL domain-containing protein [unclassified Oceanispirochaeta]MBF9014965.1 EAL domain-containing protein [Oceanispirochaeta sp. M2]NPD71354.1 EAL domain-containing protein [Oceanispirochaeta sp. M1]